MNVDFERKKILEIIKADLDVDELVSTLRIPYSRIYKLLKNLIEEGLVDKSELGLRITPTGRAAIEAPGRPKKKPVYRDALADAETEPQSIEAVHLPEDELE
jgi:predicted methyltransferase